MDSQRFDDLARSLGSGLSRRKFLGGVVGSVLTAIVGPLDVRSASADGCQIVGSFSTIDEIQACARLIQKEKSGTNNICDVPVLNSWSPSPIPTASQRQNFPGYLVAWIVAVATRTLARYRDGYLVASFVPACQQHDICFTTCGTTKQSCNDQFWADLSDICADTYPYTPVFRSACQAQANLYYNAVSSMVNRTFEPEQLSRCGCCLDQDCLEQGGNICGDQCLYCGQDERFDSDLCSCQPLCSLGQDLCNGECVDLLSDPSNCNECGVVCESGVCEGGQCVDPGCAENLTLCSDQCVDLANDAFNCGGCGLVCESGVCAESVCEVVACGDGLTECGGGCVDLATDPNNCAVCGNICESGLCDEATCLPCPEGTLLCPDGVTCAQTEDDCVAAACSDGQLLCGELCADIASDPFNCGGCGTNDALFVCTEGQVCIDGVCSQVDEPGICVQGAICSNNVSFPCGPGGESSGCQCFTDINQNVVCLKEELCEALEPCDGGDECPDGAVCVVEHCCGSPTPLCLHAC